MKADASTSRIVRWEILPGLPGDGPVPLHFHSGHPTPWAEGLVVRFWHDDGTDCLGNFQGSWGVHSVFELPESTVLFVIAFGACYVLPKSDPDRYTCHGHGVTGAILDERKTPLLLAYVGGDSVAYGPDGRHVWIRKDIAVDGIRLLSCVGGIVTANIEYDYEGSWRTVLINASDGSDL